LVGDYAEGIAAASAVATVRLMAPDGAVDMERRHTFEAD